MKVLSALLLLVFVASGAVTAQPDAHIIEWRQHVYSANNITGWDGDTLQVNITRPHTWTVLNSSMELEMSFNIGIDGSNTNRNMFIAVAGNTLDFCLHGITVDGALTQRATIGGGARCHPASGGSVPIEIGQEQTWTFTNTGAATIVFFVASIYVVVQDVIPIEFAIETALDQYLPALFWGGLIIFSMTRTAILPALAATMGFLGAFLPEGQGMAFVGAVFLYVLALWLHASTKTKLWVEAARPFRKKDGKP